MKKSTILSLFLFLCIALSAQSRASKVDSTNNIIVYHHETVPGYPGGFSEMFEFIYQNLKWPVGLDGCIEGRVVLRFTVEKTGELSNIRVLRSLQDLLDAEAVRVVRLMPKWIPAQRDGENIPCDFTLPVSFKISK